MVLEQDKIKVKTELKKKIRSIFSDLWVGIGEGKDPVISRKKTAIEVGVSEATLYRVVNEELNRTSDKTWRKLQRYLNISDGTWKFVPHVTNSLDIINTCRAAKTEAAMHMVVGYAGAGKTSTLKEIAKSQKFPNTYYLHCDTLVKTPVVLLEELCRVMGLRTWGSSSKVILNRIVSHLKDLDYPLLVLDDFGKVTNGVFKTLQALQDHLCEGDNNFCGIVIAGTHKLEKIIEKGCTKDDLCFQEIRDRIEFVARLSPPDLSDIRAVVKINFPELCEHIEELDWICKWAEKRSFRSLRSLIKTYKTALKNNEAKDKKDQLTRMEILVNLKDIGAERR